MNRVPSRAGWGNGTPASRARAYVLGPYLPFPRSLLRRALRPRVCRTLRRQGSQGFFECYIRGLNPSPTKGARSGT